MPLALFSTFKNAGIEEKEAKQSAQILETDFRDVRSSDEENKKEDERIQQKYFASEKKREDEIIRKR